MRIADIKIPERHRKDLGDLDDLMDSITQVGLLQPVVLLPDNTLVSGVRRIEAFKDLGRTEIPAHHVDTLDDAVKILQAERDENTCRKDFTPSELVAIGRTLEEFEGQQAKERQGTRTDLDEHSGQRPECSKGDTRDKVAAAVGTSGSTYERAKTVVAAAEAEPEKYGHLVTEMDESGKVNPALRELRQIQEHEEGKEEQVHGRKKRRHTETFPVCHAAQFATMAISQLERIRNDDPTAEEELNRVSEWITERKRTL